MKKDKLVQQVLQYVITANDKAMAALSVGTLAYTFGVERSRLSKKFKFQTGMTLEVFLLKEKMFRAAILLNSGGNITVKEISQIIGYCNSDYFIKRFREYFGIAPGAYREFKKLLTGSKEKTGGPRKQPGPPLEQEPGAPGLSPGGKNYIRMDI